MLASLLAAAATASVTIEPERLGQVPSDCDWVAEYFADGVDLEEVEAFAECLVELDAERGGDLERGVALYRLAFDLSQTDPAAPPSFGDLRYKVVLAYGINGDVAGTLREADALSGFVAREPAMRCTFFDRLAVDLQVWEQPEAVAALMDRFDLASCPRYVPRNGWDDDWSATHYERWFGNQLVAMGERPFGNPAALEGAILRFRLLVLPSFRPAFSARVDVSASGNATLSWTKLDGAGGYAPGKIATAGRRELSSSEARDFRARLADARLGEESQDWKNPTRVVDGKEVIVVCADGTQAVVEQVDLAGHRLITRHGCDPKSLGLASLIRTTLLLLPAEVVGDAAAQLDVEKSPPVTRLGV